MNRRLQNRAKKRPKREHIIKRKQPAKHHAGADLLSNAILQGIAAFLNTLMTGPPPGWQPATIQQPGVIDTTCEDVTYQRLPEAHS